MRNSPDPSEHRQHEDQFVAHVERLLSDDRLRLDTTRGRRPITGLLRDVNIRDGAIDLRRLMSQLNIPDRQLESRMPVGKIVDVAMSQRKLWIFKTPIGRLRVACVSPREALLTSGDPKPLGPKDVTKILSEVAPSGGGGVPTTLVLMSTSGFTLEAREAGERRSDRTVILVEPNNAGGWSVYGPAETKALSDLFDPEVDGEKRQRVRDEISAGMVDLTGSGVAADRIADKTQLPITVVEAELKAYAKETPGLAAKRLDGRMVLFRQGAAPAVSSGAGGSDMPLIDRVRALFARKGETEKKIAFLSERRTALSQQRDRGYEEMGSLESKEGALREEFKTTTGDLTRRRITSQLLQLRKDIERRQQLLSVLNQQINVVSTHLHNLELVQQGNGAKLPDSEEVATDAAAAEEVLARIEADNELASSVGVAGGASMSDEEQALYEELIAASAPPNEEQPPEPTPQAQQAATVKPPERDRPTPAAPAAAPQRQRSNPEPG